MKRLLVAFLIITLCFSPAYGAKKKNAKKKAPATPPSVVQGTELDQLRAHMTSTVDEIEGNKWIHEKSTKKMIDAARNNKDFFYVYLGQKIENKFIWPRLVIGFTKSGWVFFRQIIINNDGSVDSITPPRNLIHHDTLGGSIILEEVDLLASEHEALIQKIINAKKTMIRFKGDHYSHDFTLSNTQREAIKRIWRLYELMKAEIEKSSSIEGETN